MKNSELSPAEICFGLNLDLDRRSLSCFLQLAGRREFADILSSRLDANEIECFVDNFTCLLKKHLSKAEYHSLFLQDHDHYIIKDEE